LLDVQSGDAVLDLCAAPGGKTAILARRCAPGGEVIAADIHAHRLRAMQENLSRVGAENVFPVVLDGQRPLPFSRQFDRILVDASCSGTGTLARNPEIRWRLHGEELGALATQQKELLLRALRQLKPGGRLVYSTCSLEPEENEQVVRAALQKAKGFRQVGAAELRRILQSYLAEGVDAAGLVDKDGVFRAMPQRHQTDGFFAVALEHEKT
jgi:16S rRNA (cytosine967-C5)-methyltransferase